MANLIKIKVKKRFIRYDENGSIEESTLNTVILNLDNVIDAERIGSEIRFYMVCDRERIAKYESAKEAEEYFDKLYSDF